MNTGVYKESLNIAKQINLIANGTVNINGVSISGNAVKVQGFTITDNYGITLSNTNGVSILNNIIHFTLNGISDVGTNLNLIVSGNTIIGSNPTYGNGMAFEGMTNNAQILNNKISNTLHGILFDVASTNNIINGNTVQGNGLISSSDSIDEQGAGIYTVDGSTNFQILNNVVTGERDGIAVQQIGSGTASGFTISGNICTNNLNAIWLTLSNSVITKNTLSNNNEGVDIVGNNNMISLNIITNNRIVGIAITTKKSTDTNTVSGNTLSGNQGNYYIVGPGKVIGT